MTGVALTSGGASAMRCSAAFRVPVVRQHRVHRRVRHRADGPVAPPQAVAEHLRRAVPPRHVQAVRGVHQRVAEHRARRARAARVHRRALDNRVRGSLDVEPHLRGRPARRRRHAHRLAPHQRHLHRLVRRPAPARGRAQLDARHPRHRRRPAAHADVLAVLAVVLTGDESAAAGVPAVEQAPLAARAIDVVEPYRTRTLAEVRAAELSSLLYRALRVARHPAGHVRLHLRPVVVAHRAPLAVVKHLHAALVVARAADQADERAADRLGAERPGVVARRVLHRVRRGHRVGHRHLRVLGGRGGKGELDLRAAHRHPGGGGGGAGDRHRPGARRRCRAGVERLVVEQDDGGVLEHRRAKRRGDGVDLVGGVGVLRVMSQHRVLGGGRVVGGQLDGAAVERERVRGPGDAVGVRVARGHGVGEGQGGALRTRDVGRALRRAAEVEGERRRPRHRHRGGEFGGESDGLVRPVGVARGRRRAHRDVDERRRHRARFGVGVAGAHLHAVERVGEAHPHLDLLARVGGGEGVGARGRAGDVLGVGAAVVFPDPLVLEGRRQAVGVGDGAVGRGQGLPDGGGAGNRRLAGGVVVRRQAEVEGDGGLGGPVEAGGPDVGEVEGAIEGGGVEVVTGIAHVQP